MNNCPPEGILRLLGTEAVGAATFAELEAHIEHCPDCQRILDAATRAVPHAAGHPPEVPGLVIERELGRGATGVVELAWEPALKRHVAVKLFPRHSLHDPHAREHWLAEARALSRVRHDHVVAVYRVEETEDWLCLVIEYVPGRTLKDRLSEPLPPRDAAWLIEIIARAVGYFHTRGVCHLDLKPSNILLDSAPGAPWDSVSPKISDFGIARIEGEPGATMTGANGPKGTPSYMAPEQVAALPGTIGPAADIHALGALLYHLLTGRPPYQGASSAETLDQVRHEAPVSPRRLSGRIHRDLETICLKCLEKDPNRRYRTAEDLAGDLGLWLEGRPIKARRISPQERAWRWCRRHPAVASLLATLALTLATGVVGLLVLLKQAETERTRLADARRRAEAYERFSASTTDELVLLLGMTLRGMPGEATQDRLTAELLKLRDSVRALRSRDTLASAAIGMLEDQLGQALYTNLQIDDAREILKQAIADLQRSVAKSPEDRKVRHYLVDALFTYASLAGDAGQFEVALNCLDQIAAHVRAFDHPPSEFHIGTQLYAHLNVVASRLQAPEHLRHQERCRRLSRQVLAQLLGSRLDPSAEGTAPDLETLSRLFRRFNASKIYDIDYVYNGNSREDTFSSWLAVSVASLAPFRSLPAAAQFDRDPEAGSRALIAAIRARCAALGLADSLVPSTILELIRDGFVEASLARRQGQLDEARTIAGRMMPIARRLVQEYPDNAFSHRALSEAYNQKRKNAHRAGDDRGME
jgi:tRNA A-37 threonylcarbamoyl transferase component Bud32